jgi:hypothetical protein
VVPVVDAVPMAGRGGVPTVDVTPVDGPAAGLTGVLMVEAVPMAVPAVDGVPMAVPAVDGVPMAVPAVDPAAGLTAGRAIDAVQAAGSTTDPIWIVDAGGPTLQVPRVGAGWPGVAPAA